MSTCKLDLIEDIVTGNKVIQKSLHNLNKLEDERLLVLQELMTWLRTQEEELDKVLEELNSNTKH